MPYSIRIFLGLLCLLSGSVALADGNEKYSPTKLEWFVLELNAEAKQDFGANGTMASAVYIAQPPNTVLIFIQYSPDAKAAQIDSTTAVAKRVFEMKKKNYGWKWLKVEVEKKSLIEGQDAPKEVSSK